MYFTILDDAANAVDTFTDEREAARALNAIVAADPSAADRLLLLRYDHDGTPVGEAIEARVVCPAAAASAASKLVVVAWLGLRLAVDAVRRQPAEANRSVWPDAAAEAPRQGSTSANPA